MRWRPCEHERVRCIHGDEINDRKGRRRACLDCGRSLDGPLPHVCTVTGMLHVAQEGGAYVPPLARELAARVRRQLADNGLTQAMLARRVEVSEKHVSRVLNGHDDGSLPFWDALIRESGYAPTPDEPGNRPRGGAS